MIKVEQISKSFGNINAVKNINFHVERGEVFGFLGPNGAGKSTTINIINSLIQADSGEVYVNGYDLIENPKEYKKVLGVVPQEIALYDELSAYDNLMFWGGIYEISNFDLKIKVDYALEMVGLSDRKHDRIKTFSGGMKRRINIAAAILHDPLVLLMDEPTVGVDPQSRIRIYEIIEKLKATGMTILYTSHYMDEVERLCNRIAIMDKGEIISVGTLDELRVVADSKDELIVTLATWEEIELLKMKNDYEFEMHADKNQLVFQCENLSQELVKIMQRLKTLELQIEGVESKKANLESIFIKLTGKQLRD
jgi:ABC-2 type transport system ATP-binding protein